ncbi:MAG: sugar phosphate isomerase/epimerase [Verrucomicrobiales bacterium]|nr:sugar phosphate isomerase/epimerase [Verrucomicrobiales bacterium]
MQHQFTRRQFLHKSAGAGLAAATLGPLLPEVRAIPPLARPGSPRLLLGLAAYSFRDFFKDADHKRDKPPPEADQMNMFQFVDYCAEHGCDGAELTSYYFPSDLTSEYLLRLKRHAFLRGVAISGTAIGNTFTYPPGEKRAAEIERTKKWVDHAAVLGAPHIRVFAGTTLGNSKEESKKLCLAALEECAEYAGAKGIILGLENHGGIVAEAEDILEIVRAVKSPWIGINLDTGNFHTDDPYADLERCAPYAVNVQFKVEMEKRGGPKGPADLPRVLKILRGANYQGYLTLEYEAAENPKIAVPRHLKRMRESLRMG